MPASLAWEEAIAKATLLKTNLTAPVKTFIGLSTLAPAEVTKKTTAKEFGEKEPTEANGWERIELSTEAAEWLLTKAEGETGFTKYTYEKEIKFKKLTAGEYALQTFAITEKKTTAEAGNILAYGKMEPKQTINNAVELSIAVKKLIVEFE